MRRPGLTGRFRPIAIFVAAVWVAIGCGPGAASGQTLTNGVINNFEIAPAGSLEWQILDRLAATSRYEPQDLPRLARLTVLESIAMYENARADLRETIMGARIEGEMSVLWDSAELFYASVTPGDAVSLVRARPLLGDVEAAYERLGATLGNMPGISQLAAFHLRDIARMLPVMNTLIDAMEAEAVPAPEPVAPALDLASLREPARLLVEDLRGVARSFMDVKPPPSGRDAVVADLERFADLVQGLDRLLAMRAPAADIIESLRILRSRLWPIQARFLQLARTPEVAGRWRRIRQRMNALSDAFDRPRVIVVKPTVAGTGAGVDRRMLAQADRAIASVDEFVGTISSNGTVSGGLQFRDELSQLRRQLFLFRQQVVDGEPSPVLSRSLGDIEALVGRLGDRARAESRIFRGQVRIDPRGLQATSQAVEKLRELFSRGIQGSGTPARGSPP